MVFKLVQMDSEEPCKIQLRIGKHIIGRGKLLNCDDKRISRNHGELEVTEDTVVVKALHQNPCFIIRKETVETQILEQNCTSTLSNGDRFGLLPHTYWYELLLCTAADNDQPTSTTREMNEDIDSIATEPFEAESGEASLEINFNLNETVPNEGGPGSPSLMPSESNNLDTASIAAADSQSDQVQDGKKSPINRSHISDDKKVSDLDAATTTAADSQSDQVQDGKKSPIKRSHSSDDKKVSDLDAATTAAADSQSDQVQDGKKSPIKRSHSSDDKKVSDLDAATTAAADSQSDQVQDGKKSPIKRSHSSEDNKVSDSKKIKTENEGDPTVKQEPIDAQDSSNPAPVPNSDQANNQPGPSNANNQNKDAANAPPNPLKRERCMYGASCYRRNPQHKAQFSHPSDADWGAGDRGECPWGAACRRRDPRHWRDHQHPPGVQPPADNQGMQVVRRHGNTFYINAHTVNFHDDHFEVMDSDGGDSVDYDYEF